MDVAREAVRGGKWTEAEALILESGSSLEISRAFHAVAKGIYWKDKNLGHARAMLEEGIAYALAEAASDELKSAAKAMSFDLASFCWPGWDEPGIEISDEDIAAGIEAADRNLALAIELKKGDGPMANAYFIVGAYQLTGRHFTDALISFTHFRSHAVSGKDVPSTRLADGYIALTQWLNGDPDGEESFVAITDRLNSSCNENEVYFAQQLKSAAKICRA